MEKYRKVSQSAILDQNTAVFRLLVDYQSSVFFTIRLFRRFVAGFEPFFSRFVVVFHTFSNRYSASRIMSQIAK